MGSLLQMTHLHQLLLCKNGEIDEKEDVPADGEATFTQLLFE